MPKAIAIPYIIAIFLGIIVLALIVYLIYRTVSTPQIDCNACKAQFTSWCRLCWSTCFSGNRIDDKLCDCLNKCGISCSTGDSCEADSMKNGCKAVGVEERTC